MSAETVAAAPAESSEVARAAASPASRLEIAGVAFVTVLAMALYAWKMATPSIFFDDFDLVVEARTWSETLGRLFYPHNEHMSPLLRLATRLLLDVGGLPRVGLTFGSLSLVVFVALLGVTYAYMRTEGLPPTAALAGLAFFGITIVYYEAVGWYSSSFISLALLFIILGMLAARSAVRRPSAGSWLRVNVCAFLAACSFSSGILAGLIIPLQAWLEAAGGPRRRLLFAVACLPGWALYLSIYATVARPLVERLAHYGDKSVYQTADISNGLINTARALVDVGLVGNIGLLGLTWTGNWPAVLCGAITVFLLGVGVWAVLRGSRLVAVALCLLLANSILIYSFRGFVPYDATLVWGRYHLFSQLGLALLLAAGLQRLRPGSGPITGRGLAGPLVFALVLFGLHAGNDRVRHNIYIHPGQAPQLARLEALFALAREHGVPASLASAWLNPEIGGKPAGTRLGNYYVEPPAASIEGWERFAAVASPLLDHLALRVPAAARGGAD